MLMYMLNDAGEPELCEDYLAWALWFEDGEQRFVAEDCVSARDGRSKVRVSTMFIGIDTSLGSIKPPLLWETMVFGGAMHRFCERHGSLADAVDKHQKTVAAVKHLEGQQ